MQKHTSSGAWKLDRAQSRAYSAECSKQKKLGKRFRAVETTVLIDGGFAKAMTTAETAANGMGEALSGYKLTAISTALRVRKHRNSV